MSTEELLLSLRDDRLPATSSPEEVRSKMMKLLATIERWPLRFKDAQLLRQACTETITRFELDNDKKLTAAVEARFSFEFIPKVTKLNLSTSKKKVEPLSVDEIAVGLASEEGMKPTVDEKERAASSSGIDPFTLSSPKKRYFLCSVRRQQTALWTAYRMYLDGTQEFDSTGRLINYVPNDPPISLLGAKKFKTGAGAQSLIWNLPDIKLWKDKNAVGKLSRLPNSVYYGMPLPTAGLAVDTAPSPLPRDASTTSFDSGSEHGENAVTTQPTDQNTTQGESTGIAEESQAGASASSAQQVGSRPPSTRWAFRPPTAPTAGSGATTASSTSAPTTAQASTPDGSIALSVSTTGMDKLIHLNGIAARKPATANHADPGTTAGSDPDTVSLTESQHLEKLEALLRKESSAADFEDPSLLLFRSRLPRKVPSAGGKTTHAVAFGNVSRVRAASRKNLALDALTAATSNASEAACTVEWTADNNKPALLQVTYLSLIRLRSSARGGDSRWSSRSFA
jgi:hypothetical protein